MGFFLISQVKSWVMCAMSALRKEEMASQGEVQKTPYIAVMADININILWLSGHEN